MRHWLIALTCFTMACSASESTKDADSDEGTTGETAESDTGTEGTEDTDDSDGPPEASTAYFYAESVINVDNGAFIFEETYWVRRDLLPDTSTIEEQFIAEADGTVTEAILTVSADAARFELVINDGEYTGSGNLYGEAWAWSSWDSISYASDGSSVHSEDTMTETGITTHKVGFGTDGLQEWELDEELTEVSEADWQAGVDAAAR